MRFQRQRAWTESHRADDVLDWTLFKRMDEQVWLPLINQLEQEHQEDGFDKSFFLKLMAGDGASKPENWERLVRDWKVCIDHQVLNKLKDFISLRQNNFETGLVRMMDQITRNMKTKGVSEQRAVQAWELMTNGWTETEFERRLNQVKIQDQYPEIKEIVAKMGRVADANGKDRLTIASGVEMKMEHSAGSDIEGITVGDDLNSLLPLELAQYSDEDMEGLFIYKYRTRRLQTFRYKSEMSKASRKLVDERKPHLLIHSLKESPVEHIISPMTFRPGTLALESHVMNAFHDELSHTIIEYLALDFAVHHLTHEFLHLFTSFRNRHFQGKEMNQIILQRVFLQIPRHDGACRIRNLYLPRLAEVVQHLQVILRFRQILVILVFHKSKFLSLLHQIFCENSSCTLHFGSARAGLVIFCRSC
jgi:hypothetical protein